MSSPICRSLNFWKRYIRKITIFDSHKFPEFQDTGFFRVSVHFVLILLTGICNSMQLRQRYSLWNLWNRQKIGYHFFSGILTGGDRSLTRSPCRLSSVGRPILISVNARVFCTQVHVYQLTNNNQTDRHTDGRVLTKIFLQCIYIISSHCSIALGLSTYNVSMQMNRTFHFL